MRWDRLFSDLEARFEELEDAEAAAELADRQRVAFGELRATARLAGSIGQPVRVRIAGGALVTGILQRVGPDWLLLTEAQGREAVIALGAMTAVEGLTASTGQELSGVLLRLDLRHTLRGLARDRAPVTVALAGWVGGAPMVVSQGAASGTEITGTIDRVGADFIEVAVHAAWEPRRANTVRSVALVPLTAVVLVRALPLG
jgi:hypothetical protein